MGISKRPSLCMTKWIVTAYKTMKKKSATEIIEQKQNKPILQVFFFDFCFCCSYPCFTLPLGASIETVPKENIVSLKKNRNHISGTRTMQNILSR